MATYRIVIRSNDSYSIVCEADCVAVYSPFPVPKFIVDCAIKMVPRGFAIVVECADQTVSQYISALCALRRRLPTTPTPAHYVTVPAHLQQLYDQITTHKMPPPKVRDVARFKNFIGKTQGLSEIWNLPDADLYTLYNAIVHE